MRSFLKSVFLVILFAGAYYVLEIVFSVDTPNKHVHFSISYPFLVFLSVADVPVIGGFGIALGNIVTQNQAGNAVDWGIIICAFLNCVTIGYAMKKIDLRNEYFGRDQIVYFSRVQIISNVFCWVGVYPLFTFLVKHVEYWKVLDWGMWQSFGNTLSCLLAATLFIVLYSRSQFTEANFYRS